MREQTFYNWLGQELASSRFSLLPLYEMKDRLLYVEAPEIRKKYMDVIGVIEEPVLQAELEVNLLRKKVEMIQIAINRREPIDMEKIEAQLAQIRDEQIEELESADKTLNELPVLTDAEQHTMHRIYRDIINKYHPGLNPDVSDTQKELYEKAMDAYRKQDLEALKLINDMLNYAPETDGSAMAEMPTSGAAQESEKPKESYGKIASALATDYTLAKELYSCFAVLEQDTVVLNSIAEYKSQRQKLEKEIEEIRTGFPFNALAVLKDQKKIDEYLAELRVRNQHCDEERAALEAKIAKMAEESA